MAWTKKADWLPISNALGQVSFWQGDLAQAQQYLTYVKSFRRYGLPNYRKMERLAQNDVNLSKRELAKSKAKLAATYIRVNAHYRNRK